MNTNHLPTGTSSTETQTATSDAPRELARRSALASFVGTSIEWYDFYAYGTAATLIFPKVFFAQLHGNLGIIVSLSTFSVAFLLRPLGGIFFGHFGDRIGRKRMLVITLTMMGLGTLLIGCLPSFDQIGMAAPVLLVVLRMIQGLAIGGEWGGAALLVVENAPSRRRGLYGSALQIGAPFGLLLATGAFALCSRLTDSQLLDWGWRIPFLASALLLITGVYVRLRIEDSPAFSAVRAAGRTARLPLAQVLRTAKRTTILLIFTQMVINTGWYVFTTYSVVYATHDLNIPGQWVLNAVFLAAALDILLQPVFGGLSDRLGRRPVYLFGTAVTGLMAFPFFRLMETKQESLIILGMVLAFGIGHSATGSINGPLYAEQYPTHIRYTGISVSYQMSSLITSTPVAPLAAALVAMTGAVSLVSAYVVLAALVSFGCVLLLRETYHDDITT
jgi:MFS transporter, MHS family, shikimate and dehydroshikimate transport protein